MGKLLLVAITTASIFAAGCMPAVHHVVLADLDGDGTAERVGVEKRQNELVITFSGGSLAQKPQTLSFGIDSSRQDAVCGLPVDLEVSQADCVPDALGSEPLEGCAATPRSQDVALSDGMCDSIHMYWNKEKNAVWWWRL